MAEKGPVTYQRIGPIGVITLGAPPSNELDRPEFISADRFRDWTSDPALKGLIIRGEGRNFSTGGKLDALFRFDADLLHDMVLQGHALLDQIHRLDLPVIAAINRVCFGGGLEIALACHIRIASENALLAFPEVNQGLMPGLGGTFRLPPLAGFSASASMILGGDIVNAADAKRMGIVDYLAPKDQAFEAALSLLHKMTADRPVRVIRSVMQALRNAYKLSRPEAMAEEVRLFCELAAEEALRRRKGDR